VMTRLERGGLVLYTFAHLSAAGVRHGVSTRLGGASEGPFATLNLSYSVGDEEGRVVSNRRSVFASLAVEENWVVSSHQVHGNNVCRITREARGRGAIRLGTAIPATDALVTNEPGVYLFMRYADCVPILLCDPTRGVVGLAHAGWKGTVGNIAGNTVRTMVRAFGCAPSNILAGIGPAVARCHYAVQEDVASQVRANLSFWAFVLHHGASDSLMLDLPEATAWQLVAAGVPQANIALSGMCTACHTDEFYSYRAEGGRTGRFGALIGWSG